MPVNQTVKEKKVFFEGDDLKGEPAFTAPIDWCRQKRLAKKGYFADHSRAFILKAPKPRKAKPIEYGRRFRPGEILSGDRFIGRLEMFQCR